ncbi:unnamed protein product [Toxocara canis]|uniref:Apple domain-containing protein n=1 Tax=Toxocara canis TaxID=6265 RepID=A0A183U0B5_TOXCA|nr:unnamed protein product [Toxocara canis]
MTLFASSYSLRFKRHRCEVREIRNVNDLSIENEEYDNNDSCRERCNAQWKSDFAVRKLMHFQKNYDEDFYEFPLDGSVTSSLHNFTTFCRITKEKVTCWEQRCHMRRENIPWTTDVHICLISKKQFEASLGCLNKTSEGAHNGCNALCRNSAKKYRIGTTEKEYLTSLHLNTVNNHQYRELNKQCFFQICQLRCREELTRRLCDLADRRQAIDVLEDYYRNDHLDQLHFLSASGNGAVFPLMCRRLLPSRYQVIYYITHLKLFID